MERVRKLISRADEAIFGTNPFAPGSFGPGTTHHPDQDTPEKLYARYESDMQLIREMQIRELREALKQPTLVGKISAVVELFTSSNWIGSPLFAVGTSEARI